MRVSRQMKPDQTEAESMNFYLDDRLQGDVLDRALAFLWAEYIDQGAALFGRQTPDSLEDFRRACGGALDGANDQDVYTIIQFAVQRVRWQNHLRSLVLGRYKWGRIVDVMDGDRFPICAFMNGKFLGVTAAAAVTESFLRLSSAEQGSIIRRALARVKHPAFIESVMSGMEKDIVPEHLLWENLGIPPFHELCSCRVEGVETAVGDRAPEE